MFDVVQIRAYVGVAFEIPACYKERAPTVSVIVAPTSIIPKINK